MAELTSVIMQTYIKNPLICHMTLASLHAIRKFTDEPYELIVVDNEPVYPGWLDPKIFYRHINPDVNIVNESDIGCYASYNQAAKKAKGDYLVFIQNDVFVHEGWLQGLRYYLEHGHDLVFPDQAPRSREYVLESNKMAWDDPKALDGSRDAGLMMIKKKSFERIGGWPELTKTAILTEKHMYERMSKFNLGWTDTRKVIITHLMAGTNMVKYHEDFKGYKEDLVKEESL